MSFEQMRLQFVNQNRSSVHEPESLLAASRQSHVAVSVNCAAQSESRSRPQVLLVLITTIHQIKKERNAMNLLRIRHFVSKLELPTDDSLMFMAGMAIGNLFPDKK